MDLWHLLHTSSSASFFWTPFCSHVACIPFSFDEQDRVSLGFLHIGVFLTNTCRADNLLVINYSFINVVVSPAKTKIDPFHKAQPHLAQGRPTNLVLSISGMEAIFWSMPVSITLAASWNWERKRLRWVAVYHSQSSQETLHALRYFTSN